MTIICRNCGRPIALSPATHLWWATDGSEPDCPHEPRGMSAIPEDICPETNGGHCYHWYDPADRSCCACGAVNWAMADEAELQ